MVWGPIGLVVLAGALPAFLAGWAPWEIIVLAAVVGAAGAVLAAVWAWYAVQVRRAELAALTSDEQAARLLGESLGRCGAFLAGPASQEIWNTFVALPGEAKRAMALAIVGLINSEEEYLAVPKITALARSFRGPGADAPAALTTDEQAARVFGEALGKCGEALSETAVGEMWEAYAALPGESKRAMASAVAGYISAGDPLATDEFEEKLTHLVRSFRTKKTLDELLTPETETPAAP